MNIPFDLTFLRSRRAQVRIGAITLACATVGLVYALLAPRWYSSVLTLVPAKSQRGGGGLASMLSGDAAGVAAGFLDGAGGGADTPRIAAVLQSIAVTDAVIEKFDLRTRYREKYQESARTALWAHCDVRILPKPQLVQLTCEDQDPAFVKQMLEYFAEDGNRVFRRVGVSSASEEVRFLEARVVELRRQADDASRRMREFQEQYRIVDLEAQARAVVSQMATLNSRRISKQLELEFQRTYSAGEEASLRQLESQVRVMGEKQRDLEEPLPSSVPSDSRKARPGLFPPALEVPKLRAQYESLVRDRKVAEATLIFALEKLEGAKANEARDVSTFQVLDPPTLATRPYRPRRSVIFASATLLGLLAAIAFEWSRAGGTRIRALADSGAVAAPADTYHGSSSKLAR